LKIGQAVKILSKAELQLNNSPWIRVLWNPSTSNMLSKYKVVAQNLLLHMVGQEPHPTNYDLLGHYRRIIDDETAQLP